MTRKEFTLSTIAAIVLVPLIWFCAVVVMVL